MKKMIIKTVQATVRFLAWPLTVLAGCLVLLFIFYQYRVVTLSRFNQPRKAKYVFFDLGANKGDSLMNFMNLTGSAQGGQLSYTTLYPNTQLHDWTLYGFEANSYFNEQLDELKLEASSIDQTINIYQETAAWIYDGKIDFFLDTINDKHDFWGSSLNKDHPDAIQSQKNLDEGKTKKKSRVTVDSVSIARLLGQYTEDDTIVVKMDVEGSEYELLLDWIKNDVLKLVDHLACEFHPYVNKQFDQKATDGFKAIVKFFNVKLINWF
jgi:FkbM family methyltransferase